MPDRAVAVVSIPAITRIFACDCSFWNDAPLFLSQKSFLLGNQCMMACFSSRLNNL
jgi:hypothetical protein